MNKLSKKFISTSLVAAMFICSLFVFPVNAIFDDTNTSDITNYDMTLDDILDYYNMSLNDDEQLTALPDFSNIIPEEDPYADNEWEHYYIENMTNNEIDIVIERIANGEHVMFGDGATESLSDQNLSSGNNSLSQSPARWTGGGSNNTHQWLVARAFTILQNEKNSAYNWFFASERALIMSASDYPDIDETDGVWYLNENHFYYWPEKSNLAGGTSDNAKIRFVQWYNAAVNEGLNYNYDVAFEYLGRAIHYFCDLYTPVHTGQRALSIPHAVLLATEHMEFENWANTYKSSYATSSGGVIFWLAILWH